MKYYCFDCMEELDANGFCPHCNKQNEPNKIVYRLNPGTILNNKYLVGNCLGEGGFGITYIGRDLSLDIKVAIKEYYPNGYVNRNNTHSMVVEPTTERQKAVFDKGKERFIEEARKVAKFIGEPGIVGIREYFEANGTAYIIMEYLEGENLAVYIRNHGTFDAKTIFRLILPITSSLKRVHDTQLIHRDISPDNIMYMRNGSLKLMDFGSARYFTNGQKEMSVLLKQGYAPEEQYRKNGKQGPWTDVYGLCATIYRCLTGKIPQDALERIREDNLIKPSEMGIEISPALENILLYGLAVFSENRCKSMDELSSLIELALNDPKEAERVTAGLVKPLGSKQPAAVQAAIPVVKPADSQPSAPVNAPAGAPVSAPSNAKACMRPIEFRPVNMVNQESSSAPSDNRSDNTPYAPQSAYAPQGAYTPQNPGYDNRGFQPAPVKKKSKTGLIIGIAAGAVVLIVLIIVIINAIGNKKSDKNSETESAGLDGTYLMTSLVYSGETMDVSSYNYTLVIKNNKGTEYNNGNLLNEEDALTFDTQSKTVTNGESTLSYSYDGKGTLKIYDSSDSSNYYIYTKQ